MPRRVPRQTRSRATRDRLVDAARTCFVATGYRKTQARDIARGADVAVGTFYEYFPDKRAAFIEILDTFLEGFGDLDIARFFSGPTTHDDEARMRALLDEAAAYVVSFGALFRDIYDLTVHDDDVAATVSLFERKLEGEVATILAATRLRDQPTRAPAAGRVIYGVIESVLFRLPAYAGTPELEELLSEAARCLSAYVRQLR